MKDKLAKLKELIRSDVVLVSIGLTFFLALFDAWCLFYSGGLSFSWHALIATAALLGLSLKIDERFFLWALGLSVPNLVIIFIFAVVSGIAGQFFYGIFSQLLAIAIVSAFHQRFASAYIAEAEFGRLKREYRDTKDSALARLLNFSLIGCMKERHRVISQAYHALQQVFKVDKAVVFLADYKNNLLVPYVGPGLMADKNVGNLMVTPEFWEKNAYDPEKGVLNVISGRSTLPSLRQLIPGASLDAVAVMPLSAAGKVIGLIAVVKQRPENRHYLEPELFITFAYVLASALENCQLHEMRISMLDTATKKSQQIEASFSKYVSKAVVSELVNNENLAVLGGKKRQITVMMADLRGFTRLTGVLNIEYLVQMLNTWFEEASNMILKSQGTIDKYMGDCIMVIFGAPLAKPDDQLRCVYTAFRLHEKFDQFARNLKLPHGHSLGLGISITSGEAVVGNFGSSNRMEYTAIGETVNLAARLEKIAEAGEIVVDENTFSQLPVDSFEYTVAENVAVKGIANQTVYRLNAIIKASPVDYEPV